MNLEAGVHLIGQVALHSCSLEQAAQMQQALLPEHPAGCAQLRCHCQMAPLQRWISSPPGMGPCARAELASCAAQRTAPLPLFLQV